MDILLVSFIIGLLIILADLHTVNFITPIGIGIIAYGAVLEFYPNQIVAVSAAVIITVVSYYFFMKYVSRDSQQKQATPENIYAGKKAKVIKITDNGPMIRIGDEEFYVISDDELNVGDTVVVKGIDGVKLMVEKEK